MVQGVTLTLTVEFANGNWNMENPGILKWRTWSRSSRAAVVGALVGAIVAAALTLALRHILLPWHTAAQKVNPNEFGMDASGAIWAVFTFPATLICILLNLTGNPFDLTRTVVALVFNTLTAAFLGTTLGRRLYSKFNLTKP